MDNERSLGLIGKLDRLLAKGKENLSPERVHQVRTTSRRLQTVLETLGYELDRRRRKLDKRLKWMRRGAGAVRDLDVQIAALRKLKIGREQERKTRLMQSLIERRGQRERQLAKMLADKNAQKLRKALQRWAAEIRAAKTEPMDAAPKFDAVAASLRMFAALRRQLGSLTAENLHAYRTQCKRIRYVAEMAGDRPEAKRFLAPLRRIQDAVGDWHDWLTLTETAEALLSRSVQSALVAALHNVTNAKFVEAREVCQEARRVLMAQSRAMLQQRTSPAEVASVPRKAAAAAAGMSQVA